ncbi:OmpA family protein [Comamonas sp. UBA7528]|jgi:outer membrane protein OmpA-like peptidoglycan-associated protein|uniref:OmpA family protein n=1 Tax=Comamonas sp. UBA7528 TaxID=1946391 RepID=UPI0025C09938|nr:OmpA family protein [Comamonas sp. UBA7528]
MGRLLWKWSAACWLAIGLAACQSPVPQPAAPGLSPEQVQVLRSHGFEEQGGSWALQVPSKLLFAVDTDQLGSKQADYVSQLAQDLKGVGIQSVRVEGHTDDTGPVLYNQQLSERRAQRVAEQLVRAGMDPLQISTRGWGNSKPLPMAQGQDARRENRRVAIIIPAPVGP